VTTFTLRLAGEMAAWSAGAAATAIRGAGRERAGVGGNGKGDGAGDSKDKGKDINGSGVERLEERPAPVMDGAAYAPPPIFVTARSWAAALNGKEAEIRKRLTARRIERITFAA